MNSTIAVIVLVAIVGVLMVTIVVSTVVGDVRHYKQMYENEVNMNNKLWDRYCNLTDRLSSKQSDRRIEAYVNDQLVDADMLAAIKPANTPNPGESEKHAGGPLLEEVYP